MAILVGASALTAVGTAHASPTISYDKGPKDSFTAFFGDNLGSTKFTDTFASFTVTAASAGDFLTGSLTSGSSVVFKYASIFMKGSSTAVASFDLATMKLGPVPLAAGTYYLKISGTDKPSDSFSGTLNFSAVPEPAAWSLMILGLGAVGFAMRRQRATYRVAYN